VNEFKPGDLVKKIKGAGTDGFDLWNVGLYGIVLEYEVNAVGHPLLVVLTEEGVRNWYAKYVALI
jgi:uncharacterized protein (UPF0264 family)